MEKFKCIIIEDEPLAAEVLKEYVEQIPFLELKAVCRDAFLALDIIQNEKPALLFLDLHLPKLKGFDFLKSLKNPPQVIVTTAYRDYAVEGYELNVVDYLLKPISFSRFLSAVNKLKINNTTNGQNQVNNSVNPERPYIFINVNKKKVKIFLDEILFIESKKEYISIVTPTQSYLTKFPLGEIETQLVKSNFIRVHRSFIVSKEKIKAFNAAQIEVAGINIPIGRSYKELVQTVLNGVD